MSNETIVYDWQGPLCTIVHSSDNYYCITLHRNYPEPELPADAYKWQELKLPGEEC